MFDSSLQVFLVTSVLITALPAPPLFTFTYLYTAEHRWHEDWSQFTIRSLSYQLHLLAPTYHLVYTNHVAEDCMTCVREFVLLQRKRNVFGNLDVHFVLG